MIALNFLTFFATPLDENEEDGESSENEEDNDDEGIQFLWSIDLVNWAELSFRPSIYINKWWLRGRRSPIT